MRWPMRLPIVSSSLVTVLSLSLAPTAFAADGPASTEASPSEHSPTKDTPHRRKKARDDAPQPVKLGFLGGVGFPRPFSFEAMLKIEDTVAIGAEYSFLPTTSVSGTDVSYRAVAGDLRIFPLQSAFFFGARFGRQHLSASASRTVAPYGTFDESMTVDTWFVNPRLGFLWTFGSGLTVGIDAGLQIPLSHSETSTLPASLQAKAPSGLTALTDTLGARVLPTVSLLQLGMLF